MPRSGAYDAESVRAALGPSTMWRDVRVVEQTGSTSSDLAALARLGAVEGTVVAADHQVSGRGRLDRRWDAPPGTAVTVSLLLRPAEVAVSRWPWLPLLTGVAVVAAVRAVSGVPAGLKWPNDVMVSGRKLGGILAEVVPDGAGAVVVGVGLNVSAAAAQLPPTGTSLALCGAPRTSRAELLAAVLAAVEEEYVSWRRAGGDTDPSAYRALCTTIGATVRLSVPGGDELTGMAVDVDDCGRLVLRTASGDRAFSVGDVVHVR